MASSNYIVIFKLSNIRGKKREPIPASTVDGDTDADSDSSSDEEDEEMNEDTKPILHVCVLIDIITLLGHKTQVF